MTPSVRGMVLSILMAGTLISVAVAQGDRPSSAIAIGRVKYAGGGDWYNDPSAEVNLLTYFRAQIGVDVQPRYTAVDIGSDQLFSFPFVFLTGHGNIALTPREVRNLRLYLENGGFLYADDDYGMDRSFRREMKKVLPGSNFIEVPLSHGIYARPFPFPAGPPKTHEHDSNPPQGFGVFLDGRLAVYYTFESNPSDGWVDSEVHGDPTAKREEALRFGCNILLWALTR